MKNDFSDKNLTISTKIDTLSIEERSIEAFLAHREVPDPLTAIDISAAKYTLNYDELEKRIHLWSSENSSRLSVSGSDQQWVLSKFQQINDFINRKLEQYEQEQKCIGKDKAVVIEDKNSEIQEEYKRYELIKSFPISKRDLADIIDLIAKNDFSGEGLSISTKIDTLSIKGKSTEAFLAHKEVPDPLREFDITFMKYDLNYKIEKWVALYAHDNLSADLNVSGSDETWVLGKIQQIKEFINKKYEQYEEEQKRMKKDKALAIEYRDKEIIIPENLLKRLELSRLEKLVAIAVILATIIYGVDLYLKLSHW